MLILGDEEAVGDDEGVIYEPILELVEPGREVLYERPTVTVLDIEVEEEGKPATKAPAVPPALPEGGFGGEFISVAALEDVDEGRAEGRTGAVASTSGIDARRVPWQKASISIGSPLLRLHNEIVELCRFLTPSPLETQARREAVERVSGLVRSLWPTADPRVFGSFAIGMFLPTSDIDLVVLDSGVTNVPTALRALSKALQVRQMATDIEVIDKARVPIIKFEEALSGYKFDISFNVANGPQAAGVVRDLMDRLPPMRPITLVLKIFLQQRHLNEVYTGGLGSYALLCMVAAFLQTYPGAQGQGQGASDAHGRGRKRRRGHEGDAAPPSPWRDCLGCLLVDFLLFYSRLLSVQDVGVRCADGGGFFSKHAKGFGNDRRTWLLAVEDPYDPTNDLARNSFNMGRVRQAFEYAFHCLTSPLGKGESMLGRIIRLDPAMDAVLLSRAKHTQHLAKRPFGRAMEAMPAYRGGVAAISEGIGMLTKSAENPFASGAGQDRGGAEEGGAPAPTAAKRARRERETEGQSGEVVTVEQPDASRGGFTMGRAGRGGEGKKRRRGGGAR